MNIGIEHYLTVAFILFSLGILGVLLRRNLLIIFMCLELMLNAINLLLIAFSKFNNFLDAQIMTFFIMVIAASEAAIGLAIVISVFKHYQSLDVNDLRELRG